MPVLGITGGIASGKTAFTHTLQRWLPATAFDADACAHELIAKDAVVQSEIKRAFGSDVFTNENEIDRARLRNLVFVNPGQRMKLEKILHPRIRETWLQRAERFNHHRDWFYVNIPLLYETAAERYFTTIAVVACSAWTQIRRLTSVRHLSQEIAQSIIAAQMPLSEKITRAAHVIWNDGSAALLEQQSELFSKYLTTRYE